MFNWYVLAPAEIRIHFPPRFDHARGYQIKLITILKYSTLMKQLHARLNQVLKNIPQIETPDLTQTQKDILNFLKEQTKPTLSKTISKALNLGNNSTRARLSELMSLGFIYQPGKTEHLIAELSNVGFCNVSSGSKCGYAIVNPSMLRY